MNEEQRALLNNYETWRAIEENKTATIDVSVEAFLKELDNEANARRVKEAVDIAVRTIEDVDRFPEDEDFGQALQALVDIRGILIDDRPTILVTTLAGPTTLEFT